MAELKEAPRPKTEAPSGQGKGTEVEQRASAAAPGIGNGMGLMRHFAEDMDRFFDEFGMRLPSIFGRGRAFPRRETGLIPAEWSPRVEVRERDGQILVHADLPGLSKDDVQVELTNELLTIRGERKHKKKEERDGFSYSECSYGSFYRAIPLPEGVDASKVKAEFQNGVLEVALPAPKRPETQARRVEIQEKK